MVGTSLRPPEAPRSISGRIEARVLGGFEVIANGRRLARADWQRIAAERLVKLLLITPGHALSREAAAEALWPDAEPDASRANLRKAIHFAGRALGDAAVFTTLPGRVGFEPGRLDLDLDRLRAAFDLLAGSPSRRNGGSAGDVDGGADPVASRAIDVILASGPRELLPDDAYEEWLVAPRESLRARWEHVAILAARRARELGRADDARAIADQLLDRDPTDEAAHRMVIELLASEGRHHAARRQFDACRRALRDLLDAEPAPETVDTFRAAERTASHEPGPAASLPRLVARHAELERVEPLFDRVLSGHLAALVIHGPTGIGKTRLLLEVVGYARAADWRVLEWQAVESTGTMAYAALRHGLAAGLTADQVASWGEPARSGIAAMAPGLGFAGAITFADRAALVEALVLAVEQVARSRPLVLAIDDLPWLDPSTLELLERLVAGQTPAPILVVGTCRDDEPAPEPMRRLLDRVGRSGGLDLPIGPLGLSDIEALIVGNLGGTSVQPELARRAFELSEGTPLFCLELVRAGRDHGTVRLAGERWVTTGSLVEGGIGRGAVAAAASASAALPETPETVRRLVANRSARLTGPALELVGTAAELGSEVGFATLQAVLPDLEGGLVPALDAALASGLLVERGGGYAFAHPLYRLAVRGGSGSARRAGTHLAIALALAGPVGDGSPAELERAAAASADPVAPAEHALTASDLGAPGALPVAVAFGFAAAERATRLFDPAATSLLERSLVAWQRLPRDLASQFNASAAFASLANARMNAGDDNAARAAFWEAIATARAPEELAGAYTAYCWLPYRHGDFEGCLAILEEALVRLPAEAAVPRANIRRYVGWNLGRLHRLDESIEQLEEAARVLGASDDRRSAMQALDQLGMMLEMARRSDEAIRRLEQSLAIALDLRDPRGEIVRTHLGTALVRSGSPARARLHLERALEIAHQMGDRYLESVSAWAAAEMEDALGNYEAAKEMRARELALLTSIGGNPHNEAFARAHLSHLAARTGDDDAAATEAAEARRLAAASPHAGYAARIEEALAVEHWSDLRTG
jgi:DNA-binding SARP family transcriptional activator